MKFVMIKKFKFAIIAGLIVAGMLGCHRSKNDVKNSPQNLQTSENTKNQFDETPSPVKTEINEDKKTTPLKSNDNFGLEYDSQAQSQSNTGLINTISQEESDVPLSSDSFEPKLQNHDSKVNTQASPVTQTLENITDKKLVLLETHSTKNENQAKSSLVLSKISGLWVSQEIGKFKKYFLTISRSINKNTDYKVSLVLVQDIPDLEQLHVYQPHCLFSNMQSSFDFSKQILTLKGNLAKNLCDQFENENIFLSLSKEKRTYFNNKMKKRYFENTNDFLDRISETNESITLQFEVIAKGKLVLKNLTPGFYLIHPTSAYSFISKFNGWDKIETDFYNYGFEFNQENLELN